MYKRIVVPLDGSDIAELALIEAELMAVHLNAPIHLVRVVDLSREAMRDSDDTCLDLAAVLKEELESARQYLDAVAQELGSRGISITAEVRIGPVPGQVVAATMPNDLLILSSHGRTGLSRWFMGSTAEEVVRRSTVPLLLLKSSYYNVNDSR